MMSDSDVVFLCVMFMVNGFILGMVMRGNFLK